MQLNFSNSSHELNNNLAILRSVELCAKTKRNKLVSLQALKAAQEIIIELKHQPVLFLSVKKVLQLEFQNSLLDYFEVSLTDKPICKVYLEYRDDKGYIHNSKAMMDCTPQQVKELVELFMVLDYNAIEMIFRNAGGEVK